MYFVEGNSKSSRLTANHSAMEYNPQFLLGGITLVEKKYDLDGGIGRQRRLWAEHRSRRGDVNRSQQQIPLTLRSGIDRNNGRKRNVKALVHSWHSLINPRSSQRQWWIPFIFSRPGR
jgi:hypothetical protein